MDYNGYKSIIDALVASIDDYTFSCDREQDTTEYITKMNSKANKVLAMCEMAMRHPYADSNQVSRLTDCIKTMKECITALKNGEQKFGRIARPISLFADEFSN